MVKLLLERGAKANVASMKQKETPLDLAARCGHADATRRLLEGGADPSLVDVGGRSPLWKASQCGNCEAVRALLDHEVDVNRTNAGLDTADHGMPERPRRRRAAADRKGRRRQPGGHGGSRRCSARAGTATSTSRASC